MLRARPNAVARYAGLSPVWGPPTIPGVSPIRGPPDPKEGLLMKLVRRITLALASIAALALAGGAHWRAG
jgi:hypothetical protein